MSKHIKGCNLTPNVKFLTLRVWGEDNYFFTLRVTCPPWGNSQDGVKCNWKYHRTKSWLWHLTLRLLAVKETRWESLHDSFPEERLQHAAMQCNYFFFTFLLPFWPTIVRLVSGDGDALHPIYVTLIRWKPKARVGDQTKSSWSRWKLKCGSRTFYH